MNRFSIGVIALFGLFVASCKSAKMTSSLSFHKNPIVAHRGAWEKNKLPQNSIASLREAIRIGCTGSEFDVHLTADDSLVIMHDDAYKGMQLEKVTYAELAAQPFSNGERIPTLREYLTEGMKQTQTRLVLEVKKSIISPERTLELTKKCVEEVHSLGAEKWIVYISFDYPACLKIRDLDKNANIEYLNGDVAPSKIKADKLNGIDYHFSVFKKNPEWIAECKKLGLDLNAWTVNKDEDLKYFLDEKFDFITTNAPERLFELIGK